MISGPRIPTLFPYTTLFRSSRPPAGNMLRQRTLRAARTPAIGENARRDERSSGHGPGEVVAIPARRDRKSTRLNSSHSQSSYAGFCLEKKIDWKGEYVLAER